MSMSGSDFPVDETAAGVPPARRTSRRSTPLVLQVSPLLRVLRASTNSTMTLLATSSLVISPCPERSSSIRDIRSSSTTAPMPWLSRLYILWPRSGISPPFRTSSSTKATLSCRLSSVFVHRRPPSSSSCHSLPIDHRSLHRRWSWGDCRGPSECLRRFRVGRWISWGRTFCVCRALQFFSLPSFDLRRSHRRR